MTASDDNWTIRIDPNKLYLFVSGLWFNAPSQYEPSDTVQLVCYVGFWFWGRLVLKWQGCGWSVPCRVFVVTFRSNWLKRWIVRIVYEVYKHFANQNSEIGDREFHFSVVQLLLLCGRRLIPYAVSCNDNCVIEGPANPHATEQYVTLLGWVVVLYKQELSNRHHVRRIKEVAMGWACSTNN